MPIPKSRDVGTILAFLRNDKPEWSSGQKLAVALDIARKTGNKKIKRKKKKK